MKFSERAKKMSRLKTVSTIGVMSRRLESFFTSF
jgi:hypothetical protein